ncbi:unnamed protein product [Scytosiphon promiscuus]
MRLLRSSLALAGLSTAVALTGPTPLQMDVKGGETRCLGDTVRVGEDTTFAFKLLPSKGTRTDKVQVIVEHPNGEKPYVTTLTLKGEEHRVQSDKGEGGGTYRVCFKNTQPAGSSARVELMETTVQPKEGPRNKVAKHLRPVDELLFHAKVSSLAGWVIADLREDALPSSTKIALLADRYTVLRSRINKVAGFTIIILLSVSGWQLALLNKFFR